MRKRIYKYKISMGVTTQEITMPSTAKILAVGVQHEQPVLWAEHDAYDELRETRRIMVIGTGWEFHYPENTKYLGTVILQGGYLVAHIYEV